ncbi:hypothetical protein [Caldimonas brevitalea]|nr:hypothetical protein [Caldimonas brevitalea]
MWLALGVVGAWLWFHLIVAIVVAVQVMRLRLASPYPEAEAASPLPAMTPDQAATVAELQQLGFEVVQEGRQRVGVHLFPALFFRHRTEPAFAGLTFAASPACGYPTTFYSFDADGRLLATLNRYDWLRPLLMHGLDVHDPYADSIAGQWEAHRGRLTQARHVEPAEACDRVRQAWTLAFEHDRQNGRLVGQGNVLHPSVGAALRAGWQWIRVKRKLARPYRCAATTASHAGAFLAIAMSRWRPTNENVPPSTNSRPPCCFCR